MTPQGSRIDQELSFELPHQKVTHTLIKITTFTYTTFNGTSTHYHKKAPQEGTAQLSSFCLIDQTLEIWSSAFQI